MNIETPPPTIPGIGMVILVGLILVALSLLALGTKRKVKQPNETNFQAYFYFGLFLLFLGIAWGILVQTNGVLGLIGLGLIFMAIGIANRGTWGKGKKWADFSPAERRNKISLMTGLVLLCGVLLYLLLSIR